MTDKLTEEELEIAFKEMVRTACLSLANVCFERVMKNPEDGLRYMSFLATQLDCKLTVSLKCDVPTDEVTK